ncbi:GFA family protein [Sphingosinicella sp. LHD-64]|uniref:GFA family protein n=1 Tax=Sphingosinicella sp. LHD-64 TaxID=3072139 RepID=UPI0028105B4E|nr:GFA family protein [Sphingosinicella sp. LHD-64]MDQ8755815.1 GFA family protein [Sphingosinicella sp. LHD-64]
MDDWKLPWDGGCRCGEVRIRVTKPPLLAMACHCAGCQSMSASAFSLSLAIPADGFEITAGAPVLGGLNRDVHYFCPSCMTWMFTRPGRAAGFVNLRPTMLDDHDWFEPHVETCTDEKLPWATTPAKHSFGGIPDLPVFEPLVAEYAVEGTRPV